MESKSCPHCGVDLAYEVTDPTGKTWTGSHMIGVEIQGVYDGVLYWQCPACGGMWNRWPKDHPRYVVAERYMADAGQPRRTS